VWVDAALFAVAGGLYLADCLRSEPRRGHVTEADAGSEA
jgi:hypothetical protein